MKSKPGCTPSMVSAQFITSRLPLTTSEANKLRTFFRVLFSICAMVLGFDGLTKAKRVNTTRRVLIIQLYCTMPVWEC